MMNSLFFTIRPLLDRVLPGTSTAQAGEGSTSWLNLMLIVVLALIITFLARHLSTRGRRK